MGRLAGAVSDFPLGHVLRAQLTAVSKVLVSHSPSPLPPSPLPALRLLSHTPSTQLSPLLQEEYLDTVHHSYQETHTISLARRVSS